jgi:hypothetical protein
VRGALPSAFFSNRNTSKRFFQSSGCGSFTTSPIKKHLSLGVDFIATGLVLSERGE